MPVTLLKVTKAEWERDPQLALDLARIYADVPAERLPLPPDDYIRDQFARQGTFCCGRFNDRLLGAVAMNVVDDAWWLSNLCIRKTTRRRGVASRLVTLICQQALRDGCLLRVATSTLLLGDELLLKKMGFRLVAGGEHYEMDPKASLGGKG
ncbi:MULTISPECIES: acetyl-CoA sensor PanZ family protein [Halomonadaceae]|uniref:acetyl-CoA sensor PanZ family protein n=1 Tax=Halomonadaceae TaxID=28256 RepID=UPI001583F5D8|nr:MULTISPECIES: acetyl-CoA sensor PanZ family protein [Halomonas]MDI4639183.1 PanM family protein [Halomonas sp. BMC7]NUJ60173.1 acetyl-CoA sensor PanZ family protein [Halomonas taeanensis]|tara:strand:- start:21924 stop:22379 length:456 start_codon:yes stop_codon:yes gene_type:complete